MLLKLVKIKFKSFLNSFNKKKSRIKKIGIIGSVLFSYFIFSQTMELMNIWQNLNAGGDIFIKNFVHASFSSAFFILLFGGITVTLYFNFSSKDLTLLQTLPIKNTTIWQFKYLESCIGNSFIYFFMFFPQILALGVVTDSVFYFYILALLVSIIFIFIPTALASIATSAIVTIVPIRHLKRLATILLGIIIVLFWSGLQYIRSPNFYNSPTRIDGFMQTDFHYSIFNPLYWMSNFLLHLTSSEILYSIKVLLLLLSSAIVLSFLAIYISTTLNKTSTRVEYTFLSKKSKRAHRHIKWVNLYQLYPQFQILFATMVKDLKILKRDPRLFSQFFFLIAMSLVLPLLIHEPGINFGTTNMYSVLSLIFFTNLIALFIASMLIPEEGFSFVFLKTASHLMWVFIWAKLLIAFFISFITGLLSIIILSFMFLPSPSFTIILVTLIGLFCLGSSAIGIWSGAVFVDFKWENPNQMMGSTGGLFAFILALSFSVVGMSIFMIGWIYNYKLQSIFIIFILVVVISFIGTRVANKKLENFDWIY